MKKNTLLYILLAVLLLANGFFLFKHFGDKPNHRDRGGDRNGRNSKNFIAKKLDFNDSQIQQHASLKAAHVAVMKTYDDDIKLLKDGFFGNISNENITTAQVDSIATLISEKEKLKDIAVFNHFKEVHKICNDDQKERFSSIIKNALHKRGRKGSDGSSRRREGPTRH